MIELKELEIKHENIDLDKYINFREKVKQNMKHPEWLGDFSKEDIEDLLKNGSKIFVFFKNDKEVCSTMIIPSTSRDIEKFGLDINYKETIDYGPTFVDDKFRGNRLQLQMTKYLDEYSIKKGYKYAVSTIHPDNIYSIRNLKEDCFEEIGYKEFKRGPRKIYMKKLALKLDNC